MVLPASERTVNPNPFPERIGRYELLLPIGTGGMATVFLGRATGVGRFERDVAVKVIHAHLRADEESKQLLLEEARLAARIRHANVVPVLEVGDDPFGVYLVLDYVEGDSLAGLMRDVKASGKKIPLPFIARILLDSLEGLHASHELKDEAGNPLGLVHRDFSPQNILIGLDGVTKLADFSVAKTADRVIRTHTGLVKGKIGYMSPEQARGHHVDRRCDVWAAGVVAWELIAWRRLHKNSDAVATLLNIVTEAPPLLSEVAPETPKILEEVVWKALAMDASARTPSALAFRKELEQAFRAVGPIADPHEVGEYAATIFGPRLRERSQSAAEIRKLRARMGEIARPADTDASAFGQSIVDKTPESGPRTRADAPAVLGSRQFSPANSAPAALAVPTIADSSAHIPEVELLARYTRRSRGKKVMAGGIALAAVAGIAWFATRGAGSVAETAKPAVEHASPSSAAAAAETDTARPLSLDELERPSDDPVEPDTDSTKPVPGTSPLSQHGRQRRTPPPAATAVAAPKSKAPQKLARDPYGGTK
jgi:eukaryotic-like serine/threonine-protein kinase